MAKDYYNCAKIDAHSHFGKCYLGPNSNIEIYLREVKKIGVSSVIASLAPCPEIKTKSSLLRPCVWKKENGPVTYVRQVYDDSGLVISEEPARSSPYYELNLDFVKRVKNLSSKSDLKIWIMALCHPVLDREEDITDLLSRDEIKALKIHGVASFTGPKAIKPYLVTLLKRCNKPLVVHTDLYQGAERLLIHAAYNLNHPLKWAEWAVQNKVPILLTHGARLCKEALKLINGSPNVMVGCSPDLLLLSEPQRLASPSKNFLLDLFSIVSPKQLVFDIDFGWNVSIRDDWDSSDWKMAERITEAGRRVGFSDENMIDIYFNNAKRFYHL